MIYDFLEFVKKMGVFLICAESILYFSPGNTYQKYIRVLIGFMLLAQFMIPIKAILTGQDRLSIENQVNEFRMQLESASNEGNAAFLDFQKQYDTIENSIKEEVKSRLNSVLQEKKYDFIVSNVELGSITSVILISSNIPGNLDNQLDTNIKIDNISIDKIDAAHTKETKYTEKSEELLRLFCIELGTSKEYLEVVIHD